MLHEILTGFDKINTGLIVDATFGQGGHSYEILSIFINIFYFLIAYEEAKPLLNVIGIDRDPKAIADGTYRKLQEKNIDERLTLINEKFSNISKLPLQNKTIRGVLFDLGYSTAQVSLFIFQINQMV
jgi:16S rRNA C1402 N4-methylase RsmH